MSKTFPTQAAKDAALELARASLAALEAAEVVADDGCKFELIKGAVYTVRQFGAKNKVAIAATFGGLATLSCGKGGANTRTLGRFIVYEGGVPSSVVNVSLKDVLAEGDKAAEFNTEDQPAVEPQQPELTGAYAADDTIPPATDLTGGVPAL